MQVRILLPIVTVGFLLGATVVASRFGIRQVHPFVFTTFRVILSSLAYLGIFSFSKSYPFPHQRRFWLVAGLLGLQTAVIPSVVLTMSLWYQSAGVTSLLVTLTPAMTVLLAALLLHDEPLRWNKIVGALVAFGGAGLLLVRGETGLSELGVADWRGYALTLVGILSNAISFIYMRRYLSQAEPVQVAGIATFAATGFLVVFSALTVGFDFSQVGPATWFSLIYCGLGGTFAAQLLRLWIANRFDAAITSQTEYVVPITAVVLGALLLNEQVTLTMLTGMAIIFGGIWLMNAKARKRV